MLVSGETGICAKASDFFTSLSLLHEGRISGSCLDDVRWALNSVSALPVKWF